MGCWRGVHLRRGRAWSPTNSRCLIDDEHTLTLSQNLHLHLTSRVQNDSQNTSRHERETQKRGPIERTSFSSRHVHVSCPANKSHYSGSNSNSRRARRCPRRRGSTRQPSPRDKWFRHGVFPRTTKGCLARLDRSIYTKKVKNTEFCPGKGEVSEPGVGMDPPVRGEYPGSASPLPPPPRSCTSRCACEKSKTHMHSYRHLHLMTRPDVAR